MKHYFNTLKQIYCYTMDKITYPAYCTFHVTWRCNLNCMMCNQKETREIDRQEEMALEDIKKAFSQIGKLDVIKLTGGEPFLRNDLIEMVKFFREVNRPRVIYITTNGMFTDKIIDFVEQVRDKSIILAISLDGSADVHDKIRRFNGSYKKVMETLKRLEQLKGLSLNVQINQTVLEDNIREIGKLEDAFKEFKKTYPIHYMIAEANFVVKGEGIENPINKESYYYQLPKEYIDEVLLKITKSKKGGLIEATLDRYYYKGLKNRLVHGLDKPKIKCTAMRSHFRIFPNGDILSCGRDSSSVGNLKRQSFKEIWFGDKARKKRDFVEKCRGCWSRCEVTPSAIYSGDFWKGFLYEA